MNKGSNELLPGDEGLEEPVTRLDLSLHSRVTIALCCEEGTSSTQWYSMRLSAYRNSGV